MSQKLKLSKPAVGTKPGFSVKPQSSSHSSHGRVSGASQSSGRMKKVEELLTESERLEKIPSSPAKSKALKSTPAKEPEIVKPAPPSASPQPDAHQAVAPVKPATKGQNAENGKTVPSIPNEKPAHKEPARDKPSSIKVKAAAAPSKGKSETGKKISQRLGTGASSAQLNREDKFAERTKVGTKQNQMILVIGGACGLLILILALIFSGGKHKKGSQKDEVNGSDSAELAGAPGQQASAAQAFGNFTMEQKRALWREVHLREEKVDQLAAQKYGSEVAMHDEKDMVLLRAERKKLFQFKENEMATGKSEIASRNGISVKQLQTIYDEGQLANWK